MRDSNKIIILIFVLLFVNPLFKILAQADNEGLENFSKEKTKVQQLQATGELAKEDDSTQLLKKDPNDLFIFKKSFVNGEGGIDGLRGSVNVSISKNGKEVYVLGQQDSAFAIFHFDSATKRYVFDKVYDEDSSGTPLAGIWDIETSENGKDLYISAFDADSIVHYRRLKNGEGEWVYKWSYINNQNSISGLNGPRDLVLSPDGDYLYVANELDSTIAIFTRNDNSGDLNFNTLIRESYTNAPGFKGLRGLAINSRGTKLYVAAYTGNALLSFDRDVRTGMLRYNSMLKNGQDGMRGLEGASSLFVDDLGKIFLSAFKSNAISVYSDDQKLAQLDMVSNGQRDVKFLSQPNRIVATREGDRVFVTSYGDNTLSEFSFSDEELVGERESLNFNTQENQNDKAQNEKLQLKQRSVFRDGIGGVQGLAGAWGIAEHPNGDVLVTGFKSNALSVFRVDGTQGQRLAYIETYFDNTGMVEGLFRSFDVIRSHDGRNLYVSGAFSTSLGIFSKNSEGEEWRFQESISEGVEATRISQSNEIIQNNASKLIGLWNLVESNDGKNIYATRYVDNALVNFRRDTDTGSLTYMETFYDETNEVDGLSGAYDLVISNDDASLYVSGFKDDAIAIFNRDRSDGSLQFFKVMREGLDALVDIDGTYSLAISPDNKNLYATNFIEDSVIVFNRLSDGDLIFQAKVKNGRDIPRGLEGAYSIAIHPNGKKVYVSGQDSDSLVVFDRADDGSLKLHALIQNEDRNDALRDLQDPKNILVDPNAEYLYVTEKNHLLVFKLDDAQVPRYLSRIDNYSFKDSIKGFDQVWSLSSSSDGKELYITSYSENTLSIIGLKD